MRRCVQVQLHFLDDQQGAFGTSKISYCKNAYIHFAHFEKRTKNCKDFLIADYDAEMGFISNDEFVFIKSPCFGKCNWYFCYYGTGNYIITKSDVSIFAVQVEDYNIISKSLCKVCIEYRSVTSSNFLFCISALSWPYFSRTWWKTFTHQIWHELVHGGPR